MKHLYSLACAFARPPAAASARTQIAPSVLVTKNERAGGSALRYAVAIIVFVTLTLLTAISANASVPSRPTAARIIQATRSIQIKQYEIPENAVLKQDLLQWPMAEFLLIEHHKIRAVGEDNFVPLSKAPIVVSVTGISAVPGTNNLADVYFTWRYAAADPTVRLFGCEGGGGHAVFRLYDDGWRVDDVELTVSEARSSLSAADRDEERRDVVMWDTALAAQRAAEAEQHLREAAIAQRAAERKRLSQTPTRTILEMSFPVSGPGGFGVGCCQRIILTDVNLSYSAADGMQTIWLGSVTGYHYAGSSQGGLFWIEQTLPMNQGGQQSPFFPMGTDGDRTATDRNGMKLCYALGAALDAWHKRFNDVSPSGANWQCIPAKR